MSENMKQSKGIEMVSGSLWKRPFIRLFLLCGLIGLLTGGICFFFAKGMLSLMNTKPELIDGAVLYLKIYAVGMPAMGIYNFGNGVMSASGDTKHPLMYLAFAGVINVILNLFFVIQCHMAAEGVAPTVIVILGSCVRGSYKDSLREMISRVA